MLSCILPPSILYTAFTTQIYIQYLPDPWPAVHEWVGCWARAEWPDASVSLGHSRPSPSAGQCGSSMRGWGWPGWHTAHGRPVWNIEIVTYLFNMFWEVMHWRVKEMILDVSDTMHSPQSYIFGRGSKLVIIWKRLSLLMFMQQTYKVNWLVLEKVNTAYWSCFTRSKFCSFKLPM